MENDRADLGALTIARELGGQGFLLAINESLTPEEGSRLLRKLAWQRSSA